MATKAPTQVTKVTMDDGREVEFAGKRRMLKSTLKDEASGNISIRLDFVNGETRLFTMPPQLIADFAAHGMAQKYGDVTAGEEDVSKMVALVDDLDETIQSGSWSAVREPGAGISGASILARALAEATGQTMEVIRTFLKAKDAKTKLALRADPKIRPIVDRMEAEKAARAAERAAKGGAVARATVDTTAALAELGLTSAPAEA